jgi:hypothetical protein
MTFCALAIASSRRPPATVGRFDSMARRSDSAGSAGASACVADGGFSRGFFEVGIGSSFRLPLVRGMICTPPRSVGRTRRIGSPSYRRCWYRRRGSFGREFGHWFGLSCVVLGNARIQDTTTASGSGAWRRLRGGSWAAAAAWWPRPAPGGASRSTREVSKSLSEERNLW